MRPFTLLLLVCASFTPLLVSASIFCPPDVTLNCDTDLTDFEKTGYPALGGTHVYIGASYVDQDNTTPCGVGRVTRRWYVDLNGDNNLSTHEPYCDQTIDLIDIVRNIEFEIPRDITLDCLGDIPTSTVGWTAGPCDFIGYDSEDLYFDISQDACYKVLRKHTIIDWCVYAPHDPNWNGEGIYVFDQYIKVIDKQKPAISDCDNVDYGVGVDCNASVTLTNSAIDQGNCPSSDLYWEVEIDLWADGTLDYTFSYLLNGKFNIPTKTNNENVDITIPELLSPGNHKVKWKVRDGCGNWESCLTTFRTVDNKPPTPYCHQILYASYDGSQGGFVEIEASIYDAGAFDNCSPQEKIRFAFSDDIEDDTFKINCFNQGFQFFNIYTFDKEGNYDFCPTFMLIFDNGTCNSRFAPNGVIRQANGAALPFVNLEVSRPSGFMGSWLSTSDGSVNTEDIPLFEDIIFSPTLKGLDRKSIDLEDYVLIIDHLLGKHKLQSIKSLAADLDDNRRLNVNDLILMRDYILGRKTNFSERDWAFIPNHKIADFDLKNHTNYLNITQFEGDLDFIGIMKGDISSQELDSIITRSNETLSIKSHRTLDGSNAVYIDKSVNLKGLQITLEVDGLSSITDGQIIFNTDNHVIDNNTIRILDTDIGLIDTEEPLFYLSGGAITKLNGLAINTANGKLNLLLQDIDLELKVFPNPTSQTINIGQFDIPDLEIINIYGQLMKVRSLGNGNIDVSQYPTGKYIVRSGKLFASFIKVQ